MQLQDQLRLDRETPISRGQGGQTRPFMTQETWKNLYPPPKKQGFSIALGPVLELALVNQAGFELTSLSIFVCYHCLDEKTCTFKCNHVWLKTELFKIFYHAVRMCKLLNSGEMSEQPRTLFRGLSLISSSQLLVTLVPAGYGTLFWLLRVPLDI